MKGLNSLTNGQQVNHASQASGSPPPGAYQQSLASRPDIRAQNSLCVPNRQAVKDDLIGTRAITRAMGPHRMLKSKDFFGLSYRNVLLRQEIGCSSLSI